jgi:hypothetical protein
MSDIDPGVREFENWLLDVSGAEWLWHVKYLSANDTYAKPNVHQGGPHISKALLAAAFPHLSERAEQENNPDLVLPARVDSHTESMDLRLIWYNSKRLKGQKNGRDEARLTKWGGKDSAMVEADATGSLVVLAFRLQPRKDADALRVWRCRSTAEEDYLLERVDGVEPGRGRLVSPVGLLAQDEKTGPCALTDDEIPEEWRANFPTGDEIVQWVVANRSHGRKPVDDRLMARRMCEYDVFRSIERFHAMPRIAGGFPSVDAFVEFAGSLMNRRKSRSGRSLELHARQIFQEEGVAFSWTPKTEDKKTPDFIFPSIEAYHDAAWPAERLRMLAAKTTCKDRWRQVINEADRIPVKHLLTLQEGVSVAQHKEMQQHGVQLVVPQNLVNSYPSEVQEQVVTLERFVADVRGNCGIAGEDLA